MDNVNFDSRAYCREEIDPCVLGVFGSRTLGDERVEIIILETCRKHNVTRIVTCQEPAGVSEVAQKVCKKYGYPLQLHFLNMQYLRGAFEQRSVEIIKESDMFLIIHDGESKGTLNEKILVEKSGKDFEYHKLEVSQFTKSVGFNIKKEWGSDDKKNKNKSAQDEADIDGGKDDGVWVEPDDILKGFTDAL